MPAESEQQRSGPVGLVPDLARVEEGLTRRSDELVTAARRVRSGTDALAIHDLRVATRRLTAALRAWESLLPARPGEAACRALRKLRRQVGRARELEVHLALAEARRPGPGSDGRAAVDAILARLHERLARRRRQAMKRVSPRRLKRLLRRIEAAVGGLGGQGRHAETVEAFAIERRLAERATTALCRAAERPNEVSLHEARIRVKQWRYLLECLEEAMPGVRWQAAPPLRRIQTLLGDIHDSGLLRDLFARQALKPIPAADREHLNALIGTLDQERERALRRFQRRGGAELAAGVAGPAEEEASDPVAPHAEPAEDAPASPAGEPLATDAAHTPAHDAPVDAEPADAEPAAGDREARWGRMASWLEKTGRG
jgi:CHAD domain-containing protein